MRKVNQQRVIRPTLLAVGEGYAEVAFLAHIRNLYTANRSGCHMVIKNARGKGAKHVVDYALNCASQSAYSKKLALLDTDTSCWTKALEARARRESLIIIPSNPCLEAELLKLVGERPIGNTEKIKNQFQEKFRGTAHDKNVIEAHMMRDVLEQSRQRSSFLQLLLSSIED